MEVQQIRLTVDRGWLTGGIGKRYDLLFIGLPVSPSCASSHGGEKPDTTVAASFHLSRCDGKEIARRDGPLQLRIERNRSRGRSG